VADGAAGRVFSPGNLVVYKSSPARVVSAGAKIEIEPAGGPRISVRAKDIIFLHPGPVSSANMEALPEGELREAWEILQGQRTTIDQFAELLYGRNGPAESWAVYTLLLDGLYVRGTPDEVYVLSREEHKAEAEARAAKNREAGERRLLLERVKAGKVLPEDGKTLREVEDVALGRSASSRILKDLGIPGAPENAHSLLLKLGVWDEFVNPHPRRLGFSLESDFPALETFPDAERLDLTGLESFAVDDEGSEDPDDAVSIDGDTLWIHVSDPAGAVRPGTGTDIFARERGANLYLPEKKVPMLPPEATALFGLGLQETSPALSFAVKLADDGSLAEAEIRLTRVRVTRLTYEEAQRRLDA
jgi:exoribonuclease-2